MNESNDYPHLQQDINLKAFSFCNSVQGDQSNDTVNTLRRGNEIKENDERKVPTSADRRYEKPEEIFEHERRYSHKLDLNYIDSMLKENPSLMQSLNKGDRKWEGFSQAMMERGAPQRLKSQEEIKKETFDTLQDHLNLIPPPLPYKTNNEKIDKLHDIHLARGYSLQGNIPNHLPRKMSVASEGDSLKVPEENPDNFAFESQDPHTFHLKGASNLGLNSIKNSRTSHQLIRSNSEQLSPNPVESMEILDNPGLKKSSSKKEINLKKPKKSLFSKKRRSINLEEISKEYDLKVTQPKGDIAIADSKEIPQAPKSSLAFEKEKELIPEDVESKDLDFIDFGEKEKEFNSFFDNDFSIEVKKKDEIEVEENVYRNSGMLMMDSMLHSHYDSDDEEKAAERRNLKAIEGNGKVDPIVISFGEKI